MEYAAIILFAIATCITPGPNNTMILTSGLNYGIRKSLPHYFGIVLGFSAMVLGVGLGLASLFNQNPSLHIFLKLTGAIYLSYLAYKIATAPVDEKLKSGSKPFTFIQAAAFQWVNPKAWVLAIGATATYTVANDSYGLQVLIISIIFLIFGSPCIMLWLWFGSELKRFLQKPGSVRIFNVTMALLLMGSLLPVFMDLTMEFGR
ncbi:MAG: LysE family translocator [Pseudohongiellaceae bacterium]